ALDYWIPAFAGMTIKSRGIRSTTRLQEPPHDPFASRLDLRRTGAAGDPGVLLPARGRGARAERHRLRYLRAGRHRQPALRRVRQLRWPAARPTVLEDAGQHAVFRDCRRAAFDRALAGRGGAAAFEAGTLQGLLPHRVL